ncbi:MAG: metalloregulator ArsR/SmtB family transcription factor [Bacteroidota bacterium]
MRRDVFQAIADPIRRDIIDLLADAPRTVNEVADRFDVSRPAISKHIKILTECGLVQMMQKGRERHCVIIPQELSRVSQWVSQHRPLWEQKLDTFEAYLKEIKSKTNNDESDK